MLQYCVHFESTVCGKITSPMTSCGGIFYRMIWRPPQGEREWLFTQQQELAIIEMVWENNAIRLCELQQRIIANINVFNNININISCTGCRLKGTVSGSRTCTLIRCRYLLYILYIVMWEWGFMLPPALPVACSFSLYWPNPAPTCVKI